jgi:hypothetical protein
MANDWDEMTNDEKIEILRRQMACILAALTALTSDVDQTWDTMRGTTSEMNRISKDIGTLKSLWPYTKKHSRAV